MISLLKTRLLVAGAILVAAILMNVRNACRNTRLSDVIAPGPVDPAPAHDGIDTAIFAASLILKDRENGVVSADALLEDLRASLQALVHANAGEYYDFRLQRGATLKREFVEGLFEYWSESRIVSTMPTGSSLPDRELFEFLWSTAPERHMSILAVLPDDVAAGRGVTIRPGAADWRYTAARYSSSVFSPVSGAISQDLGERLNGTDHSAHLTISVQFRGGVRGQIRLNYFFSDSQQAWFPATIVVGSDAESSWPWPAF